MIERYLLRYFLAVIDGGNFSNAAKSVNVSQPTLSAGIAKLEDLLDASLFHRTNRRVHLTEAGNRLLPFARRIESQFNQSIAAVQEVEPVRMLRLGILNTIAAGLVAPAIRAMLEADKNLRVEIVDGSERDLASKLSQERIDLALTLVERGSDRFEEKPIFQEGYLASLPGSDPLAARDTLNAEDLAQSVMIVRRQCEVLSETSRYFLERGVRPFFAYRSSQDEKVMAMIAAGLGMTIVPASHRAPGVKNVPLNGFNSLRTIGFAFAATVDIEDILSLDGIIAFQHRLESTHRQS